MINLDAKKIIFAKKIIDFKIKIFTKKRIIVLIFEIYNSNIYIIIVLIN